MSLFRLYYDDIIHFFIGKGAEEGLLGVLGSLLPEALLFPGNLGCECVSEGGKSE
jgi:hypothetical protein